MLTTTEMQKEILRLKKEKDFCILVHAYQTQDILEIADFVGDSFGLSRQAANASQQNVLMCGVRFMAETAKILSPKKNVYLSHKEAGCPMAEQMTVEEIKALKAACGDHVLKVIIETCLLTEEEKIALCGCVTEAKADYIKTSTGFSTAGATFEDIALFREHIGPAVKMKAAGGISSLEDAEHFLETGLVQAVW